MTDRLLRTCALVLSLLVAACGGGTPTGPTPVPAVAQLSKAGAAVPQNGFWWNPAESGRGYALEVQGTQVFMGAYLYEPDGAATWYLATLQLQADGGYSGTLSRYAGGQTLAGDWRAPASVTAVGTATLSFSTPTAGSLQVQPSGGGAASSTAIQRLAFGNAGAAAANFQGGLWWNPAESGRGYFVEVQGSTVAIASFMYAANGQPTWYLTTAQLQNGQTVEGVLQQYTGGQALGGAYRAPAPQAGAGNVTFSITSATTASLQLPGGRGVALKRTFGATADSCSSVRSGFAGAVETTPAGTGGDSGTGGDGGGDSGGAAAGGGLGKVLGGLVRVVDLSDNSLVGEAVTDSLLGLVTVKTCARTGPFLLTLEGQPGARYYDEALARYADFGSGQVLHALVDQWDEHVGVSPLTEAAYRYAVNQFKASPSDIQGGRAVLRTAGDLTGLTAAQVKSANGVVLAEVNRRLAANYALSSVRSLPTPIDATSGAAALSASRYGRSAAVNGGLVQAAGHYNPALPAPALALVSDLARDLTDGRIDGFALDGTAAAASYESVRLPLAGNIGTSAIATRFGASALRPTLSVDEETWVSADGANIGLDNTTVSCAAFQDDAALLSDGTVTVIRRFPTNDNGVCRYKFDTAENERQVTTRNFLTGIKALSRGSKVAYAIRTDGTVVGWGDNFCGRMHPKLANGIYSTPQVIPGVRDITAVSSDAFGTIMRDSTGAVVTWAHSLMMASAQPEGLLSCAEGAPLNGMATRYWQPGDVSRPNVAHVAEVLTSLGAFFALTTDGTLYGWGAGGFGMLANSDGTVEGEVLQAPDIPLPTPIAGLSRVRQIGMAGYTVFALQADGTVKAWGNDDAQLLGNGTPKRTTRPTLVPELTGITTLAAGVNGVRLLQSDGSVWAWGWNFQRREGRTLFYESYTPKKITTPEPIRHVTTRFSGFTVYFASGRIGREVDSAEDVGIRYR